MTSPKEDPQLSLRSVLPHEPPFPPNAKGYICLQGTFLPKCLKFLNESSLRKDERKQGLEREIMVPDEEISQRVHESLQGHVDDSLKCTELLPVSPIHVSLRKNFVKCDLVFHSQQDALTVSKFVREEGISPYDILKHYSFENIQFALEVPISDLDKDTLFSRKNLQATRLTDAPQPKSPFWPRVSPPKFRRLVDPPASAGGAYGSTETILKQLEIQRRSTRFVYVSGLRDVTFDSSRISQHLRTILNCFDSSGDGVELWEFDGKDYVYVGMRSNEDAMAVIAAMQGKFIKITNNKPYLVKPSEGENINDTFLSQKIFADWADIHHRSNAKIKNNSQLCKERGTPSKSECTSNTKNVIIPGLCVVNDFISEEMEDILLATVTGPTAAAAWFPEQDRPSGGKVSRRVQHYGYVFDYATSDVLREKGLCPPLPKVSQDEDQIDSLSTFLELAVQRRKGWDLLAGVIEKVRRHQFHSGSDQKIMTFPNINQLTVNEYKPGQGIGSHVDTPSAFEDGLLSISLNSDCVMEFRKVGGTKPTDRKLVHLPRRSIVLMSGSARYEWEHMIVGRMTDTIEGKVVRRQVRVSLTLRTALSLPSGSSGKVTCLDLYESDLFPPRIKQNEEVDNFLTPECEKKNVHAVYDAIATQWHHTRGKRGILWPKATDFIEMLPKGSIIADVGCGDGKYFAAAWKAGSIIVGSDISEPLLRTALGGTDGGKDLRQVAYDQSKASTRPNVLVADCMNLPFRTESCGKVRMCVFIYYIIFCYD